MFAASKTSTPVAAGPTSDPYFNYVTALLHGDGTNGGQNNTFVDSSTNNFAITRNGDTTQGTLGPFNGGNYSAYFDGSGDYLDLPNNTAFNQSGSWTVEMWVYPTTNPTSQYWYSQNTANFLQIATNASGFVYIDKSAVGAQITATTATQVNAWNHIAMVSNGTTLYLFVNGVMQTTASLGTTASSATTTRIGAYQGSGSLAFTGYISNVRVTKGAALYTSSFTVPTAPLNTTSQTVLLTCASNRFEDLSGANITITRNGDTSITELSPFNSYNRTPVSYSGTFNGTSDYLTVASSTAFDFSSGNFTVEFWFYATSVASQTTIIQKRSGSTFDWIFFLNAASVQWFPGFDQSTSITSSTAVAANTWNHVAGVRNGSTFTLYLNGVSVGTTTSASPISYSAGAPVNIGYDNAITARFYFAGSISNVRVVKGTALYTANFTPPTAPLTAVSGTSLLTCQSTTFVDNSTNAFAITANGSARPVKGNPFGYTTVATTGYSAASNGGSGYFDGNGDYLTAPSNAALALGSGDFTVEFWLYPTSTTQRNLVWNTTNCPAIFINSSSQLNFDNYGVGSVATTTNTVNLNAWNHCVASRSGTTLKLFVNGVQGASVTNSTNWGQSTFFIGFDSTSTYQNGYMSNVRIVKGTALYTGPFVPSGSPLTAVTNTQLLLSMTGAQIIDNAEQNDLQTVGNAQISTSVKKYGTGSLAFDGNGDALYNNYTPSISMGSANFTVEAWVNPTSFSSNNPIVESSILNQFGNADIQYQLYLNVSGYPFFKVFSSTTAYTVFQSVALPTGTWTHVAAVRNGVNLTLYINGVSVNTIATLGTASLNSTTSFLFRVGANVFATSYTWFNGYIDDLRVTRGIARYTTNFTPPAAAFPNY